ncbi:DUF4367 domain-containing protein [Rossellomorea vietnamensis]|uniref:DUF4367 domain-containing protein n=1 Tax=Rossellomorea vietnamensis TaxID=218284 RepID=UPI003CEEBF6D
MKIISSLLITLLLITVTSSIALAKETKYNHNSITIAEVKEKVNFKVLVPKKVPEEWTLEIKTPDNQEGNSSSIRLHFMDENDENLMLGIEEKKVSKRAIRKLEEEFSEGDKIKVNNVPAYYQEWANSGKTLNGKIISGGLLTWIQDGTYVQMNSSSVSKDEMVEIARTIR